MHADARYGYLNHLGLCVKLKYLKIPQNVKIFQKILQLVFFPK